MFRNTLGFILSETRLYLRRERGTAALTITTVAVLMLVLGALSLFMLDLSAWARGLRDIVEVSAYFQRDVPQERARATVALIEAWPEVRAVKFVSREEGWELLKRTVVSAEKLRNLDNPLPDAVKVFVKDPRQVTTVARKLQGVEGVRDVIPDPNETARKGSFVWTLVQFKRILDYAGYAVAALVALAASFIIHNTIRLALHARWREIYIMQLIGAGRSTIAAPFLLEGMLHGGLGALVAGCLLLPAHMYLRERSAQTLPFIVMAPDAELVPFAAGLIGAGLLLGLLGAGLSVRRYLQRKPEWHT